jgi:hypothetical protein
MKQYGFTEETLLDRLECFGASRRTRNRSDEHKIIATKSQQSKTMHDAFTDGTAVDFFCINN